MRACVCACAMQNDGRMQLVPSFNRGSRGYIHMTKQIFVFLQQITEKITKTLNGSHMKVYRYNVNSSRTCYTCTH